MVNPELLELHIPYRAKEKKPPIVIMKQKTNHTCRNSQMTAKLNDQRPSKTICLAGAIFQYIPSDETSSVSDSANLSASFAFYISRGNKKS